MNLTVCEDSGNHNFAHNFRLCSREFRYLPGVQIILNLTIEMQELDIANDISQVQLENVKKLDMNDQLKILANLLGYKCMPPTIEQFITDPYYLGDICKNLYPYWKDKLSLIYPTPIHTRYPIIVFTGAIGELPMPI